MTSKGIFQRLIDGEIIRVTNLQKKAAFRVKFEKFHEEQQIAYGWASVIEEDGREVVDHDQDTISEKELADFAQRFLLEKCGGKVMHKGERVSELVESMMFTKEKQKVLGIDLGKVGWWVGFKYHDSDTWSRIKSGELPMFSIAFDAKRRKR